MASRIFGKSVIARLRRELMRILQSADVKERLAAREFIPLGNTPEEFGAIICEEVVKWAKLVSDSGAKVDWQPVDGPTCRLLR